MTKPDLYVVPRNGEFVPVRDRMSAERLSARRSSYSPASLERGDLLDARFLVAREGGRCAFYAPLGRNPDDECRVILVCASKRVVDVRETARALRNSPLLVDRSLEEFALDVPPDMESYEVREPRVRTMLAELDVATVLAYPSPRELVAARPRRLALTAALLFPIVDCETLADSRIKGDLGTSPLLRAMLEMLLLPRLQALPSALIIPLGRVVATGLNYLCQWHGLREGRVLWGFPDPAGSEKSLRRSFPAALPSLRRKVERFLSHP